MSAYDAHLAGSDGASITLSREKVVTATVTGSTSPAYAAGDLVGGVLTFADCLSVLKGGILNSIKLRSKSVQTAGFKLYLFSANPAATTWTDNAAPNLNAADLPNLIGMYSLTGNDSGLGTMTIYSLDGIGSIIENTASSNLYGVLVTTGTPTLVSTTDLSVSIGVVQ